ncbi:MAG TPA: carbohydrate ABC transporter permease [Candidatus Limnocylindrales bacterium]|jgi:multiple sugar transport system permease protein
MTASVIAGRPNRRRIRKGRVALHAFLITMSVVWLWPLAWALLNALRPLSDTIKNGSWSWPTTLNLNNFINGFQQANLGYYYLNTLIVVVPAVLIVLLVASLVAFALTRVRSRVNLFLLLMFTAGNLLPPQVIIVPLYYIFNWIPLPSAVADNGRLYDQYIGIILIHVVFQMGFCIFVLSNYMRTLPKELNEAALVDGASLFRTFRSVILPLCAPALAALGTLEFTFIYNDFFWALLLMKTGSKRPITSALNNLQGQFFTDQNVLAAVALMVAVPTIIVYIALQRHFIRGLTLGSTKG